MTKVYRIKGRAVSKKQYMEQMRAIHASKYQKKGIKIKNKNKKILKSPQRKMEYHSSTIKKKTKKILKPPKGTTINPDGSITIRQDLAHYYQGDHGLKGSYRKSFVELSKDDKNREFSATYDFEDDNNEKLKDIDIRRGTTAKENKSGRASVTSRIDPSDSITVHNHPLQNDASFSWNRPSGTDISNIIYFGFSHKFPKLKESYIVQPDGRFVRYKVTDLKKASDMYSKAQDIYEGLFREKKPLSYSGGPDYVIESKFSDLRKNEQRLGNQDKLDSKKADSLITLKFAVFQLKDEAMSKEIKELEKKGIAKTKKNPNLNVNKTAEFIKLQKIDGERIELFDNYLKQEEEVRKRFPPRQNFKYIPDKRKKETQAQYQIRRSVTVERRAYTKWIKYIKSEWGVEVQRMPKNFVREF